MGKLKWVVIMLIGLTMSCSKDSPRRVEKGNPGDAAEAILSDKRYDKIVLEIAYPDGYEPQVATVQNIVDFIKTYCDKPGGVRVVYNNVKIGTSARSASDIRVIESNNRTTKAKSDELSLWVFINNGGSTQDNRDAKILGVAYASTSIAMYGSSVHESSGGILQVSRVDAETVVLEHELGHLFGLVNNGSKMVRHHEDTNNGKHCTVENCLMYYAVETNELFAILGSGGTIPEFDPLCKEDLKANGGK